MSNAITDGGIYCGDRTYAEHCAWLDSLSADETLIVHSAVGKKYTLVFVSLVKRLLAEEMPMAYRLRFLEWLEKCGDQWLTPEIIALVEPMCDAGYEIVHEAMKLAAKKALDVFASWNVFNAFCALNPSLLEALRMPKNMRIYWRPGIDREQANRQN